MPAEDMERFVVEWWRRSRRRVLESFLGVSRNASRCGHTPTGFRPGVLDCTRRPHAADVPHRYEKNHARGGLPCE